MDMPARLYRYRSLSDEEMLNRELDTLRNSYLSGGPGDRIVDARPPALALNKLLIMKFGFDIRPQRSARSLQS